MYKADQIIYFSTYDDIKNPYYGGGGAIAVHEVAKRLVPRYDVHVVSWDYCGKKKEIIDGVVYERFGWKVLPPKFAMFVYQITLPVIVANKSFAIWFESFCPPFTTAFLPLFSKKPVVGVVHMLAAEDMQRKYKLPFHIVQNAGLKLYKHLIVTSNSLQQQVQKIDLKIKVSVISNGIGQVFPPVKNKKKYFLFLGRIEIDQKGMDLLLKSFSQFLIYDKEYKLIIAGSGNPNEIDSLNRIIQKNKLSKNVELAGKVNGAKKEYLLRNAAGVLVTSRFETYSLVALEAMAFGAPVVCFSLKGLSWIPKNAAKKIRPFDTQAFTDAMISLISNQHETIVIIKQAHNYVKQFTWETIAQQYKTFIQDIWVKDEK